MEDCEKVLQVLTSMQETMEEKTTRPKRKLFSRWSKEDKQQTSSSDLFEASSTPPDVSVPFEERLAWSVKTLKTVVFNRKIRSDSRESIERRLREGIRRLSKKDKTTAHWMEHTYTEVTRFERMRISQESFQRSGRLKDPRRLLSRALSDRGPRCEHGGREMLEVIQDDCSESSATSPRRARDSFSGRDLCRSASEYSEQDKKHSFDSKVMATVATPFNDPGARTMEYTRMMSELPTDVAGEPSDPRCLELLEQVDSWDFDTFALNEVCGGQPLFTVSMKIFHERGLFESLNIGVDIAARFFQAAESMYGRHPDPFYHNNEHAADVVQAVHCLLDTPALLDCFSALEVFSVLVAAAVHDIDHPGRTNTFLVKTEAPLAILYNDASVLENHHVSTTFRLLQNQECNILQSFDKQDRTVVRKLMVEMILGTDMVKHAKGLGELRSVVDKVRDAGVARDLRHFFAENVEDRTAVLCQLVHSADLSTSARPWPLCEQWTHRVLEEFLMEGDEERRLGLDIGALNDRSTIVIPKTQVGFISCITLPLWHTWSELVQPESETVQLQNNKTNLMIWQNRAEGLSNGGTESESADGMTPVRTHPSVPLHIIEDTDCEEEQRTSAEPPASPGRTVSVV